MWAFGATGASNPWMSLAACVAPSLSAMEMRGMASMACRTPASIAIDRRSITASVVRYSDAIFSSASPASGAAPSPGMSAAPCRALRNWCCFNSCSSFR